MFSKKNYKIIILAQNDTSATTLEFGAWQKKKYQSITLKPSECTTY